MQRCDAVVVGGGPGGAACAWQLVRAGLDVVVRDSKSFPRDKVCAGWITPQVIAALDLDVDDYRRHHVFQPFFGFRTGLVGGRQVESRYAEPVSFGIRRCEFDDYLLRRSGARCQLGDPVRALERTADGWLVDGCIEAPVVVGAGGHFCPVARMLGARRLPGASVVAAQEVEYELSAAERSSIDLDPRIPELYFCDDLQGYGWCVRKGDFVNIGLGRLGDEPLAAHVAAFCDHLRTTRGIECREHGRMRGHAYQLYERTIPRLVDVGVLLVGDAAGLAYPQSGEGIRPAVESGLMAAEVISEAAGDYRTANLESYRQRVLERFGTPRAASVTDRLPAAWLRLAAARCLASRWFARHVVLERWFLHAHQPALEVAPPAEVAAAAG